MEISVPTPYEAIRSGNLGAGARIQERPWKPTFPGVREIIGWAARDLSNTSNLRFSRFVIAVIPGRGSRRFVDLPHCGPTLVGPHELKETYGWIGCLDRQTIVLSGSLAVRSCSGPFLVALPRSMLFSSAGWPLRNILCGESGDRVGPQRSPRGSNDVHEEPPPSRESLSGLLQDCCGPPVGSKVHQSPLEPLDGLPINRHGAGCALPGTDSHPCLHGSEQEDLGQELPGLALRAKFFSPAVPELLPSQPDGPCHAPYSSGRTGAPAGLGYRLTNLWRKKGDSFNPIREYQCRI